MVYDMIIHLTGSCSCAMASIVAATQAAPPMSALIRPILAAGLMEIPPVSKVTPARRIKYHIHLIFRGGLSFVYLASQWPFTNSQT